MQKHHPIISLKDIKKPHCYNNAGKTLAAPCSSGSLYYYNLVPGTFLSMLRYTGGRNDRGVNCHAHQGQEREWCSSAGWVKGSLRPGI